MSLFWNFGFVYIFKIFFFFELLFGKSPLGREVNSTPRTKLKVWNEVSEHMANHLTVVVEIFNNGCHAYIRINLAFQLNFKFNRIIMLLKISQFVTFHHLITNYLPLQIKKKKSKAKTKYMRQYIPVKNL